MKSSFPRESCSRRSTIQTQRSEEHTSELQSRLHLVCRLLLEKKKCTTTSASTKTIKSPEAPRAPLFLAAACPTPPGTRSTINSAGVSEILHTRRCPSAPPDL